MPGGAQPSEQYRADAGDRNRRGHARTPYLRPRPQGAGASDSEWIDPFVYMRYKRWTW